MCARARRLRPTHLCRALAARRLRYAGRRNGATAFDIMRQTGHRSVAIVSRYIREAELFRDSPASKLGL